MSNRITQIQEIVWSVANRIAKKDELAEIFSLSRVDREDFIRVLNEYGRTVISPPKNAYNDIEPIKVEVGNTDEWAVDAPLWTEEEGMSDLSIILTITFAPEGPAIEIDDLRVL